MFDREFRKAIKLDCAGEEDKALEIYQNLSRKNKDYPILYYYISVIFENSEEHEKALLNVDKSLELKPNYHKALHQKGFILMNLEKYDGALKYTDKALKIKETSQLFINKINILNELKRYNESLKCCDELIKFDPSNEDNYLMKINPLISLNCEKEAFDLVNQILENDENNVYALNNKALIFNSKGNYLNALKYLNKSLSIEEFNPWAVHVKISILIELAKYDEASKCLKKYYSLIDKNSKSEKAWFFDLKRMLYYYSNDYEKALEYSKKTLKLDNCDIDYYLSKIYILKELKYEKELEKCCKYALSLIDEKLKINNNNVTLLLDKVDVYIHLKECDKSIELLKSIEIDVIDKNSFRYKGYLFSQVGRYEEALENYNKSLKIDPENIICLNNKAYALIKLNKFDESLDAVNKALEIIPNYWLSLHNKAFALEKLKRYDEALEYYNRAFEINPYDKELQEDRENLLKKIKKE
jgi:tetratricopeptide (TPR) repeat protein